MGGMKIPRTIALISALLAAVAVEADVVTTSDGSRLVGRVIRLHDGRLVIETSIAGTIELDASQITAMDVDGSVNVQFDSGDRLVGRVTSSEKANTSVVETAIGHIEVETAKVASIWPEGVDSPEVVIAKRQAEDARTAYHKEMEERIAGLTPKWTAALEAGILRTEGNTDRLEARGRFDLRRQTDEELLHFYLAADFGEQNEVRTENEYKGGIRYDRNLTERLAWYTRFELEFDEFEDLDLRATAATGLAYYWIKKENHELKPRAGLGYRHESFDDGRSRDDAILELGFDYRLDIFTWAQFTHSTTWNPAWDDLDDYRLSLDTAMLIPLKDDRFSLKLGVRNEYNSRPVQGNDKLDNTYYANLVFTITE